MMIPLPSEMALIDLEALKPYQWTGLDAEGANTILDETGWQRGADGIRAKGGVKLSFQVMCPYGWSDWNAALEVVAQSTRVIGIDLRTSFPDAPIWSAARFSGEFDIIMDSPGGQGIASPWTRARAMMGSSYLPPAGVPNMVGNYGRFINAEAQELIDLIPNETDPEKLKDLWTKLNIIYLQEMPVAGLMYRPWLFHQVSAKTWTGFPKMGDGTNIPPTILVDGSGIKGLYNLRLR